MHKIVTTSPLFVPTEDAILLRDFVAIYQTAALPPDRTFDIRQCYLMPLSLQLDLVSGGQAELLLSEPDQFPSSYFLSLEPAGERAGALWCWQLVMSILVASERSVCWFSSGLRRLGLNRNDVADSAMGDLLKKTGYAFGIFWDVDPALKDSDLGRSKTFVFVRDPRDLVLSSFSAMPNAKADNPARQSTEPAKNPSSVSILDFVRSPEVDHIARRYRRFADFCRSLGNVKVFRYEDLMFSWRKVAADLIESLDLQISREAAFAIADSTATLAQKLRIAEQQQKHSDDAAVAVLEEKFADPMAYFGYVPEKTVPADFRERQTEFLRAISDRLSTTNALCQGLSLSSSSQTAGEGKPAIGGPSGNSPRKIARDPAIVVARPLGYAESDPVLLWRLKANASRRIKILGREIAMDVDSVGCRPVVGQPQSGEKTFAAYGCSVTFGIAIPAEETFCSVLQSMFPTWRVENHGVGGYSGVQNLIQLQRDSRWGAADYVTFCWIQHHLLRNVADPSWLSGMTDGRRGDGASRAQAGPEAKFPRASLDRDGELEFRSVRFPRRDLLDIDLDDFTPDPYYLELVCFNLFSRAAELVKENGGHFFVTVLHGHLSNQLQRKLDDSGIPVVDASVIGREYTCLPDDPHPNALANRIFAEKIRDYLLKRETP
jgi:hypothetical protein